MFQSAPLTEARGDALISIVAALKKASRWFQSAPLTEARGDPTQLLKLISMTSGKFGFQSAPLTEARGDFPHQLGA